MGLRVFDGSVAIITGAASGIGRALAEQLASCGSTVILADLQANLLQKAVRDITAGGGGRAFAVEVDVRSFPQVQSLVSTTMEEQGRIDFMFNNAGIGIGGNIDQHLPEDWDRIIDINLKGVAYGVQAALGPMLAQGFGHIINTASISGLIPMPGVVAYSATKHAIVGLSKSLRGELRKSGIRVSALCPGAVDTPMLTGGRFGRFYGVTEVVAKHILSAFPPMDPTVFAAKALTAVKKNQALIVIPWQYRILWQLLKRMPTSWEIHIAANHMSKRKAEAEQKWSGATAPWDLPAPSPSRPPSYPRIGTGK